MKEIHTIKYTFSGNTMNIFSILYLSSCTFTWRLNVTDRKLTDCFQIVGERVIERRTFNFLKLMSWQTFYV